MSDKKQHAITVDLAKVDYDYGEPMLKTIISPPHDYDLVRCIVTVCTPGKDDALFEILPDQETLQYPIEYIIRNIPLSQFFKDNKYIPSIFKIKLEAMNSTTYDVINRELWVSDVHDVHHYFLNELLSVDKCEPLSDELIKKYLILYGHQQALSEQQFDVAMSLFTLLRNNFSKCPHSNQSEINCNCHGRY